MIKFSRNEKLNKKLYPKVVGRLVKVNGNCARFELPYKDDKTFSLNTWLNKWVPGKDLEIGKNYELTLSLNEYNGAVYYNLRAYRLTDRAITNKTTIYGTIQKVENKGRHEIVYVTDIPVLNIYKVWNIEDEDIGKTDEIEVKITKCPKYDDKGAVDESDKYQGKDGKMYQNYYPTVVLGWDD